ncbi:GntR family transcriptional regulator [Streptomyces sp. 900105755]
MPAESPHARSTADPARPQQAIKSEGIRAEGGVRVRRALAAAVREAARSGRLAPGTRPLSPRRLTADLGIARNTVAGAYGDLVAEGWLTARRGSGTLVTDSTITRPVPDRPAAEPSGETCHALIPGSPDLTAFPRAAWLKATRRAPATAPDDAFGYGDPRGRPELRAPLADHPARAQGAYTSPEHKPICTDAPHNLQIPSKLPADRRAQNTAIESHTPNSHRDLPATARLERAT